MVAELNKICIDCNRYNVAKAFEANKDIYLNVLIDAAKKGTVKSVSDQKFLASLLKFIGVKEQVKKYNFKSEPIDISLKINIAKKGISKQSLRNSKSIVAGIEKLLGKAQEIIYGEVEKLSPESKISYFKDYHIFSDTKKKYNIFVNRCHDVCDIIENDDEELMESDFYDSLEELSKALLGVDTPLLDDCYSIYNLIIPFDYNVKEDGNLYSKYCEYIESIKDKTVLDCVESIVHTEKNKFKDYSYFKYNMWLDSIEDILNETLLDRKIFLDRFEVICMNTILDKVHGLEQILEKEPSKFDNFITLKNSIETYSSIMIPNNSGNYPMIDYSKKVKQDIGQIYNRILGLLSKFPSNFSDIAISNKLKNKKNLLFTIEELPKDPFDLRIGNESGCCIATDSDEFVSLIDYINNDKCKFFGLYMKRSETSKKKRIGFVLSFDANDYEHKNNLILNSLEFSRFNIPGGNDSYNKIVDFVEDWFSQYSKVNNYARCLMGAYEKNIAYRFGSRKKELSKNRFFVDTRYSIMSNVFDDDSIVNPGSCYIIR